jgi:hypothetical protein
MVPVAKNDGELFVVLMLLLRWVDDHWRTETINVLALQKTYVSAKIYFIHENLRLHESESNTFPIVQR